MAVLDRCIFNAASGGTADFVVASAVTGYMTPTQAGAVNGGDYNYVAQSTDLSQWEIGPGTYSTSGPTLARGTVLFNSAGTGTAQGGGGAKINFTVAPQVYVTPLATDFGGRTVLTADATYYVDSATGSDSNPGTSGSPFATLQHAWDFISATLDLASFSVAINLVGAGPYTLVALNGLVGGSALNIVGAGASTTTINDLDFGSDPITSARLAFLLGPPVFVDAVNLVDTGSGTVLISAAVGSINVGLNAAVTAAPGPFTFGFNADNVGTAISLGDVTFTTGTWLLGVNPGSGGIIYNEGPIQFSGTPAFLAAFILCEVGGIFYQPIGIGYSGAVAPGLGALAISGGVVDIQGFGASNLPGGGGIVAVANATYEGPTDQEITPTDAGTVTMVPHFKELILTPAGPLTSLTVTLPSMVVLGLVPYSFPDGLRVTVSNPTANTISVLVVNDPDAATVNGAPGTLVGGAVFALKYNVGTTAWNLTG